MRFLDFGNSLTAMIMYYVLDVPRGESIFGASDVSVQRKMSPRPIPILECGVWQGKMNLRDEKGTEWAGEDDLSECEINMGNELPITKVTVDRVKLGTCSDKGTKDVYEDKKMRRWMIKTLELI